MHRSLLNWEWYKDINTKTVFIHLLLTVNTDDKTWQKITIKRGQRIASSHSLAEEIGLSRQQIRTSLDKLKSTNEITITATNKYSIIEVLNYSLYQDIKKTNNQQDNKQTDTKITTKKQYNNNINIYGQKFNSFWDKYPKKVAKQAAKKAFERLHVDEDLLTTILSAIEKQKQSPEWKKDNGKYIPHPATWLNGRRWEDEEEADIASGDGWEVLR